MSAEPKEKKLLLIQIVQKKSCLQSRLSKQMNAIFRKKSMSLMQNMSIVTSVVMQKDLPMIHYRIFTMRFRRTVISE